jgi:hypothetical protein
MFNMDAFIMYCIFAIWILCLIETTFISIKREHVKSPILQAMIILIALAPILYNSSPLLIYLLVSQ